MPKNDRCNTCGRCVDANMPIIDVLKELKFSRPMWTQKMIDIFIIDAEKQCLQYEGDGTFSRIVNDVWEKG